MVLNSNHVRCLKKKKILSTLPLSSSSSSPITNRRQMTTLQDRSLVEDMHQLNVQDSDDDGQPLFQPSSRPAQFVKPAIVAPFNHNVPTEFQTTQALYGRYLQKVYLEGYVEKKNEFAMDGQPCQEPWSRWYMELCGPSLLLWPDVEDQTTPQLINIVEAAVEMFEEGSVFSLNSAGANQFLFSTEIANQWIAAIRLSTFESIRIQEIFTYRLLSSQADLLAKPINKMEGAVQIRFEGAWDKYWVVISDKTKKLFSGKKPSSGKIQIYESKKAKSPLQTFISVSQLHVIYPEPPQAIDSATVFKIVGKTEEKDITCFIMVPSRELSPWVVSVMDVFKLHGRPLHLLDDATNPQSLNFGETLQSPSLFLSLSEVLAGQDPTSALQQKAKQQRANTRASQSQMGLIHQIPGANQTAPRNQRGSVLPPPHMNMTQRAPNASLNVPSKSGGLASSGASINAPSLSGSRRVVYASDDEEEEEEEEDKESDSDESVTKTHTKPNTLTALPATDESSFKNSVLEDIEKKNPTQTSFSSKGKESEEEKPRAPRHKTTQISDSEDDDEEEEEEEEEGYSDSDDDVPIHQSRQSMYNQSVYNDQYMYDGQYYDDGYPITEDGPVIPQLGDHFATQNSLLDTFRPDYPSARDQEGYARATGQPLIQVPNKPPEPRSGLVGMISQIEHEKKQKESSKGRLMDRERILDRERERYLMEQRSQQHMMQPPMMGSGMMNQPMMNSMPQMPMMQGQVPGNGQMPMMGMMGQPMMYPMMNMPMMYPMMDPHMSMMMMQQQYGQLNPMWNQSQMFGSQYNGEEEDDDDDDVPLGAKDTASTHKH